MSNLIKCPDCAKEVSSKAPYCVSCGAPLKSSVAKSAGGAFNWKDPVHCIGGILAIIIVTLFVILIVAVIVINA